MRSRGLALLAAALLVGCGGGSGQAIPVSALPRLVLQPSDLPSGFVRFDFGTLLRADASPPRDDPTRFGRLEGWKARYRRAGSSSTAGALVVESRADLFGSDGGAKRDLGAYRQEFESLRTAGALTTLPKPTLGEDAVAAELRQGEIVYFRIAWRERNATASINVSGFAKRTSVGDALAIARKQAARVHAAAAP